MMKQEYQDPAAAGRPITPPPELVWQLADGPGTWLDQIINAYRAGADQELEACCAWMDTERDWRLTSDCLRAARRPPALSLKEQALEALARQERGSLRPEAMADADTIRRALEQLDD